MSDTSRPVKASAHVVGVEEPASRRRPSDSFTGPRVGRDFVALYALAYMGTTLLFLAPLLVSLSLKVNALVGTEQAPNSLALVAGTGALLSMVANEFFGKLSDLTTARLVMRRPCMLL